MSLLNEVKIKIDEKEAYDDQPLWKK